MTQAAVTTDSSGWFKAVSPGFLELIGRPVEALAGVNLVDLVHPLDAAAVRLLLTEPDDGATSSAPVRLLNADDSWRAMGMSVLDAGDGRLTVALVAAAADDPFETSAASATPVWSVADAATFPPPPADGSAREFAADDVPSKRAAVRNSVPTDSPMIELDPSGRTTFATGPWSVLAPTSANGAAAAAEFLEAGSLSDTVRSLIADVMSSGQARQIHAPTAAGSRWLQILPIPSPHYQGQLHALVTVNDSQAPGELIEGPVTAAPPAPSEVSASLEPQPLEPQSSEPQSSEPEPVAAIHDLPEPVQSIDDTKKSGFGAFGWLAAAIGAVLLIVLASQIFSGGDDDATAGPVDLEITNSDPIVTAPGQSWRSTGVESLGEAHGIVATDSAVYVAGVNGTLAVLDNSGAAVSALSVGGDETTFVSDLDTDESGTVWILDAGQGRLFRATGESVTEVAAADANALRNARGIGGSSDGNVWIASTAAAQLTKVSSNGAFVDVIALPGRQPSDVIQGPDGTLWIIDSQEIELLHLTTEGQVLSTVELESFTSLHSPHLAIVGDRLWVTEPELSGVFAVDLGSGEPTGDRVDLIRPGPLRVEKPIGISADEDGRLWIVDSTGGGTLIIDN